MTDPTRRSDPGGPAVSERLQELLARASEDQVQEQRAVSATLADLRREVAQLGEGLGGTGSAVAAARTGLDGLAERLGAVESRLGELRDLVDQEAAATATRVLSGVSDLVREASDASERRVVAHVDEAVLALAEALLRRRSPSRPDAPVAVTPLAPQTAPRNAGPTALSEALQGSALDTGVLEIAALDAAITAAEQEAPDASATQEDLAETGQATAVEEDALEAEGAVTGSGRAEPEPEPDEPCRSLLDPADVEPAPASATTRPPRPGVTGGNAPPRARPGAQPPSRDPVPSDPPPPAVVGDEDDVRRRPWWRPGG